MAKIFINPGHGSPDPGSVSPRTGFTEAEAVLPIGEKMAWYLREVGHEVRLWQNDYLTGVIQDANKWGADVFISIHCNSFGDPQAHGTETWYHPNSSKGRILSQCLQDQMLGEMGLRDRGIKPMDWGNNYLGVLDKTSMPSALVELAFISNLNEENLLHEVDRWGACLARGVTDYCLAVGI